MKYDKMIKILLIIVIVLYTVSYVPKEFQNDTFFTIAIGDKLVNNQDVNTLVWEDDINYVHSGFYDYIIVFLYNQMGFFGIRLFVILLAIIEMLLYYYILNKKIKNDVISFLFTLLVIRFASVQFIARSMQISFLLFLVEYYCLDQLSQIFKKRYIITLMLVPVLIANLHASVFLVYFIMYLPYIANIIFSKIFKDRSGKIILRNIKNQKYIIIMFMFGIIAGFCTPTGLEPFTDMINVMYGISSDFIGELQPVVIIYDFSICFPIILVVAILMFSRTKIDLIDGLYILGFTLMAIAAHRCFGFFYLISSICIIKLINDFLCEYEVPLQKIENRRFINIFFSGFIIILSINACSRIINNMRVGYAEQGNYPVDATEYILENIDISNMRIYNHFNFGSYLEFKGIPVFIDSRSGMFTPEFNPGVNVLEDWYNAISGNVSYKEIFDKYDITHALLYNGEIINTYIVDDPEWEQIYKDNSFSLYERVNK